MPLIAERGEVEVGCEFCGLKYRFDSVEVGEMFSRRPTSRRRRARFSRGCRRRSQPV